MAIVANTPEYTFLFILGLCVLIVKFTLSIYLGKKVIEKKRESGEFSFDFLFSIFILMVCALISRSIYIYYDFFLTEFTASELYKYPNVIYWKLAGFIGPLGLVTVLYAVDKKVLKNKFKGILAYFSLAVLIVLLFYPITTKEDFEFVSTIGLIGILPFILIPVIFLYLAIKTPGLRTTCLMIFLGIIIFAFGSILVGENFLAPLRSLYGVQVETIAYTIFFISKIIGLTLLAVSVTKFTL